MSQEPSNSDLKSLILGVKVENSELKKLIIGLAERLESFRKDTLFRFDSVNLRIDNGNAQLSAKIDDLASETKERDDAILEKLDAHIVWSERTYQKAG